MYSHANFSSVEQYNYGEHHFHLIGITPLYSFVTPLTKFVCAFTRLHTIIDLPTPTYKQERRLWVDDLFCPYQTPMCRRVVTFPEYGLNQSVDGTAQRVIVISRDYDLVRVYE
jgi:hypothetical protein